jgi:pimeloyl-ACP methyl ester carboxylesterase
MGTDLYYEIQGNGPPLVLAHGLGGNHASWFNQVPFFARWFQVVTFDHRGFGNSRDAQGGADRSRFVDDLKELLDDLGIAKTALVAQSMGGGTCATFTVLHPDRVTALVLADTLVGITIPESLRVRMDAVRNATSGLPQLERVLSDGFREREPVLTHLYTELNNFNKGARESLRGNLPGVTVEQLSAVNIPVLFLVGTKDILFPPDLMRSIHELIPGSEYQEIADSGHSVYFEKPHHFNEIVLNFLKKCGAAHQ